MIKLKYFIGLIVVSLLSCNINSNNKLNVKIQNDKFSQFYSTVEQLPTIKLNQKYNRETIELLTENNKCLKRNMAIFLCEYANYCIDELYFCDKGYCLVHKLKISNKKAFVYHTYESQADIEKLILATYSKSGIISKIVLYSYNKDYHLFESQIDKKGIVKTKAIYFPLDDVYFSNRIDSLYFYIDVTKMEFKVNNKGNFISNKEAESKKYIAKYISSKIPDSFVYPVIHPDSVTNK